MFYIIKIIIVCCRVILICKLEVVYCFEVLYMLVVGLVLEEFSFLYFLIDYVVNWICCYVRGVKVIVEVFDKIFWRMLIGSVVYFIWCFWWGLEVMICDGFVEKNVWIVLFYFWKFVEFFCICFLVLDC